MRLLAHTIIISSVLIGGDIAFNRGHATDVACHHTSKAIERLAQGIRSAGATVTYVVRRVIS